jgi:hypothetical protein
VMYPWMYYSSSNLNVQYACLASCDASHQIDLFTCHRNATVVLSLGNLVRFPPLPCHIHIPLRNSVYNDNTRWASNFNLGHAYSTRTSTGSASQATLYAVSSHPSNTLRSVHIPIILVKMTSCAISYKNDYGK